MNDVTLERYVIESVTKELKREKNGFCSEKVITVWSCYGKNRKRVTLGERKTLHSIHMPMFNELTLAENTKINSDL